MPETRFCPPFSAWNPRFSMFSPAAMLRYDFPDEPYQFGAGLFTAV
jgi:hypothetical protein